MSHLYTGPIRQALSPCSLATRSRRQDEAEANLIWTFFMEILHEQLA